MIESCLDFNLEHTVNHLLFVMTNFCKLPAINWFAATNFCVILEHLYGKNWSVARNIHNNEALGTS